MTKGAQPPPPEKIFWAHICCRQMAAWIKMPLGMEVGLGPGNFVLDGDPAPLLKKGAEPPNFRSMFTVAKRLDGSRRTWHGGRPQPKRLCVRWGPSPLPINGAEPPSNFRPIPGAKMPLHIEVGLSPGDFVLDSNPAPPPKGGGAPDFRPMFIVAKRLDGSRWYLAWRWASVQATLC